VKLQSFHCLLSLTDRSIFLCKPADLSLPRPWIILEGLPNELKDLSYVIDALRVKVWLEGRFSKVFDLSGLAEFLIFYEKIGQRNPLAISGRD
jgi:hypothetical protein